MPKNKQLSTDVAQGTTIAEIHGPEVSWADYCMMSPKRKRTCWQTADLRIYRIKDLSDKHAVNILNFTLAWASNQIDHADEMLMDHGWVSAHEFMVWNSATVWMIACLCNKRGWISPEEFKPWREAFEDMTVPTQNPRSLPM